MNEDFVTFELAKKLKEKGLEWNKITTYNPRTNVRTNHLEPTISQVLKWLREEKKLFVEVYMYYNHYLWEIYNTEIFEADSTQKSEKYCEDEFQSYEEAAVAGIEYVLDNLI